jgi:hypothetical protein
MYCGSDVDDPECAAPETNYKNFFFCASCISALIELAMKISSSALAALVHSLNWQ